jgi:hypothetical protein
MAARVAVALRNGEATVGDVDGVIGVRGLHAIRLIADGSCRVRIYDTAAHRLADAARPIGTLPDDDAGVLLEVVLSAPDAVLDIPIPGAPACYSNEVAAELPFRLSTLDAVSIPLNCDLIYQPTEA